MIRQADQCIAEWNLQQDDEYAVRHLAGEWQGMVQAHLSMKLYEPMLRKEYEALVSSVSPGSLFLYTTIYILYT